MATANMNQQVLIGRRVDLEAFLGNYLINTGGNRVESHLVLRIALTMLCKLIKRNICQAETARHL